MSKPKMLPIPTAFEAVTGTRPHPTTCWRWWKRGTKGIRLETWVVGGRRYTTMSAVKSFIEATTEAHNVEAFTPSIDQSDEARAKRAAIIAKSPQQRLVKKHLFKLLGIEDPTKPSKQSAGKTTAATV